MFVFYAQSPREAETNREREIEGDERERGRERKRERERRGWGGREEGGKEENCHTHTDRLRTDSEE